MATGSPASSPASPRWRRCRNGRSTCTLASGACRSTTASAPTPARRPGTSTGRSSGASRRRSRGPGTRCSAAGSRSSMPSTARTGKGPRPVHRVRRAVDRPPVPLLRVPSGRAKHPYRGRRFVTGMAAPSGPESDPRASLRPRLFVVGAGIMGSGIAAQAALKGWAVTLEDVREELARRGLENARRALGSAVRKGRLTIADQETALANIDIAIGLRRAEGASLVLEAAPENLALKRALFQELEEVVPAGPVLATNTSSLPVTQIAAGLKDPGRVVGIHFFNPVLQMELVEIIPGHLTRPEVLETARRFAEGLGKTVVSSRDTPGFVTTRAMAVLINEAAWMLFEGTATREDIDVAYKLGFHHPMGPLELADLVGIDTTLAILDVLWDGFRDPKYRACPILRTMVAAGQLGRKSGAGFYPYPPAGTGPTP